MCTLTDVKVLGWPKSSFSFSSYGTSQMTLFSNPVLQIEGRKYSEQSGSVQRNEENWNSNYISKRKELPPYSVIL